MSLSTVLLAAYPGIATAHAGVGAVALAAFWAAAFARKGTAVHRRIGQAYLLAMAGILLTGSAMALAKGLKGQPVAAAFLGYLLLITATAVWSSWRAVRDRDDVARYTGPVFVGLGVASFLAAAGVLVLGLQKGVPLLVGFSTVGLVVGVDMVRKRLHRRRLACASACTGAAWPSSRCGGAASTTPRCWATRWPPTSPSLSSACRSCCRR